MTASRLARRLVVVAGAVTVGFGAQLASTAAPAHQSAPLAAPGRPASGMIPATDPDDTEGFTADLRRQDARGLGRRPDLLARREWRHCRRDHGGEAGQGQHVPDMARRRRAGLRVEGRLPAQRREQRHPVPQCRSAERGEVRPQRLSGRHGLRAGLPRQHPRRARPRSRCRAHHPLAARSDHSHRRRAQVQRDRQDRGPDACCAAS